MGDDEVTEQLDGHEQDGSGGATDRSAAPAAGPGRPSPEAARRLAEALSERTDAFHLRTSVELSLVDAMLRMGAEDAARDALDDCGRILQAYARDVEAAVAEAAVVRDAEQAAVDAPDARARAKEIEQVAQARATLDAAAPAASAAPVASAAPASAAPVASAAPAPAAPAASAAPAAGADAPRRTLRRMLVSAAGVAAIALAVLPAWRAPAPVQQLTAAELQVQQELAEARYRLAARAHQPTSAREVTAEARELHGQILAIPDRSLGREAVRRELRLLLDVEQEALEDVVDRTPEARGLINEIHAIRESLDLDAPGVPDAEPEVPTAVDVDVPLGVVPEPAPPSEVPPPLDPSAAETPPLPVDEPTTPAPQPTASEPPAVDDGSTVIEPDNDDRPVPVAP